MTPFASFQFFEILFLYAVLPVVILGLLGKARAPVCIAVSSILLGVVYFDPLTIFPGFEVRELWIILGYAIYTFGISSLFLWIKSRTIIVKGAPIGWKVRLPLYSALLLTVLPLLTAKVLPYVAPETTFGFVGISYVTFRALDVVFSIGDGVVKAVAPGQFAAFLFFFPTVASGPIDRYKRFTQDWIKSRSRSEFLDDLDVAVQHVMRGFLYKFLIAALIDFHLCAPLLKESGFWTGIGYMYAYTAYLFFDFAGYTAFAIGIGALLGVKVPPNFDKPFLAENIREFWNRWHMSLSFWFRDHVYMRFLLAAGKGKWFKGKYTANYVGLYLTFGLMGIWHGLALHFIIYGLYHATLLSAFDWFARWNKTHHWWPEGAKWKWGNIAITFHAFAFGLLIFSGHLIPPPPPGIDEMVESVDSREVIGRAWHRTKSAGGLAVDIYVDYGWVERVPVDEYRDELAVRGYSHGRHGFRAKLPEWVSNGNPHVVEVRLVGSKRVMRGCPKRVIGEPVVAPPPEPGSPATTN